MPSRLDRLPRGVMHRKFAACDDHLITRDHLSVYAIAARPAPAPLVRAISSGHAPIKVANVWRKLAATEKKARSSTMCGRYFRRNCIRCTAFSATRGIAAWAAKFKYVASSIGNHSFFQSIHCFRVISSHQPRIRACLLSKRRMRDCTISGDKRQCN